MTTEEDIIRKDRATIDRLLDDANDAYDTHIKLEDEFQQTLGLARRLIPLTQVRLYVV